MTPKRDRRAAPLAKAAADFHVAQVQEDAEAHQDAATTAAAAATTEIPCDRKRDREAEFCEKCFAAADFARTTEAGAAKPPSATLLPGPQVLPQQIMAVSHGLTVALAKEQEDNKRLRAELRHVHETGNRREEDRAQFEKLSLERWNEIQELKAINVRLRYEIKALQGAVSSLTQKVDQQAAKLSQQKKKSAERDEKLSQMVVLLVELRDVQPLQASIALGRMQANLKSEFRAFWTLFFDKDKAKKLQPFMTVSTMLRHRRETTHKLITTDDDACFDAFVKKHPGLADPDVTSHFLEIETEPTCSLGAYPPSHVFSEGDCRAYFGELFPRHEVDFPGLLDSYVDLVCMQGE
jgi:hypothetical protein